METKTQTKPVSPSPAQALKIIANLVSLYHNHKAQKEARLAELMDMIGTTDIAEAIARTPEKLTELGTEVASLKAQTDLADMAIASTRRRIRELGPLAIQEIFRLKEELTALLAESHALAQQVAKAPLQHFCGGIVDQADIDYLLRRTRVMRAQAAHESTHSDMISLPIASTVKDGVVTDAPHEDAYREPAIFLHCYDVLQVRIEATTVRIAELRQAETDFENSRQNELGQLKKENAALRAQLAAK